MNTMLKTAHAAEVLEGFPQTLDPLDADGRAAAQPAGARHRQPGRAPRRLGAAGAGQVSWASSCGRATPSSSRRRPSPATRCAVARILNALSEKGVTRHRRLGRPLPRLGPRQPARPRDDAGAGAPADAACRCTASTATSRRRPRSPRERGIAAAMAPNGTLVDLTGDAPKLVEKVETGRIYLDGTRADRRAWTGWCASASAWRSAATWRSASSSTSAAARSAAPGSRRRGLPDNPKMRDGARGRAGGRARPGARARQARRARRRRRARRADPAHLRADLQRRHRQEAGRAR